MASRRKRRPPAVPKRIAAIPCPRLTVDAILYRRGKGVLLIKRKNPPHGWALPGGFVDYGECAEVAVCRETLEETGMVVTELAQLRTYSDPARDPRMHTVGVVFAVKGTGEPTAADDAKDVGYFPLDRLPRLAFDHKKILTDYKNKRDARRWEKAPG